MRTAVFGQVAGIWLVHEFLLFVSWNAVDADWRIGWRFFGQFLLPGRFQSDNETSAPHVTPRERGFLSRGNAGMAREQ